jgi:hypothetical protein
MTERSSDARPSYGVGYLSPRAGRGRIALAIRVRGSFRERGGDCFKNSRHVAQHIAIPEPQNAIVVIDKPLIPGYVARVIGVLASIHLNNETAIAAHQINCVRTDRRLPDELITVDAARSQPIPKSLLRIGSGSSQASGALGFDFISSSLAETPPHPDCFAIRPLPARGERLSPRAIP